MSVFSPECTLTLLLRSSKNTTLLHFATILETRNRSQWLPRVRNPHHDVAFSRLLPFRPLQILHPAPTGIDEACTSLGAAIPSQPNKWKFRVICTPFRREHRDLVEQRTAQIVRASGRPKSLFSVSFLSPTEELEGIVARRAYRGLERGAPSFCQTCPPVRNPWTQSHSFLC